MANLIDENMDSFEEAVEALDIDDEISGKYFSPLTNYCVTSSNMKFYNELPATTEATLLILKSRRGGYYTLAYPTGMADETKKELEEKLKAHLGENIYLASGTCSVDASSDNTTDIRLTLTGATKQLRFDNQNIVQITDSSGNDEIYINTQGVATNAELDFSKGEADTDTIYFNGATTVQNISGGGQTGVHLL